MNIMWGLGGGFNKLPPSRPLIFEVEREGVRD